MYNLPRRRHHKNLKGNHFTNRFRYHTVGEQHYQRPRQQTVVTASKQRQTEGGSHESGSFYRSVSAATDRHRLTTLPLMFVVVGGSSSNIATEPQQ